MQEFFQTKNKSEISPHPLTKRVDVFHSEKNICKIFVKYNGWRNEQYDTTELATHIRHRNC